MMAASERSLNELARSAWNTKRNSVLYLGYSPCGAGVNSPRKYLRNGVGQPVTPRSARIAALMCMGIVGHAVTRETNSGSTIDTSAFLWVQVVVQLDSVTGIFCMISMTSGVLGKGLIIPWFRVRIPEAPVVQTDSAEDRSVRSPICSLLFAGKSSVSPKHGPSGKPHGCRGVRRMGRRLLA